MERFLVNAAEQVDEPPAPRIAACDILKQWNTRTRIEQNEY